MSDTSDSFPDDVMREKIITSRSPDFPATLSDAVSSVVISSE